MLLFARLAKQLDGRTLYERFELVISAIVMAFISAVIVCFTILALISLIEDFSAGLTSMEAGLFKDTFGTILTILILLEFNHSIISALRQRTGTIQVSIIVLITITVIARKLILLDYATARLETLLGLGGLALILGIVYWLLASIEQRRGSSAPERQMLP